MEVVEDERQRAVGRAAREERVDGLEELEALGVAAARAARGEVRAGALARVGQEMRHGPGRTGEESLEAATGSRAEHAYDPSPGRQRRRRLCADSPSSGDIRPASARARDEQLGRSRLPDSRLAGQQEDAAAARQRGVEALGEARSQFFTAHVRAQLVASWCRYACIPGDHADRCAEAVAAARDGLDRGRLGAPIVDREPGEAHGAAERALRDDCVPPDTLEQLVLGYGAVARVDQVEEQAERLRLERHPHAFAAQLPAPLVQLEVPEGKDHTRSEADPP